MKKVQILFFIFLLFLGFSFRLYRFSNPIADWHSWRQSDTSAVSQNFIDHGFDVLHPMYYDISNVQSGKDNPMGYRYVEFPLYNIAQAGLYKIFGTLTIEEWGRLVSIFSSLFGSIFLFLLVKRHTSVITAWFVFIFSLFLPYNIYYGRTILPDTSMVMAILGGIYFFDKFSSANSKYPVSNIYLLISLIFTSSALLLKPYALFYVLVFLILGWNAWGMKMLVQWELWVYATVSLLPLFLWRRYILQFPQGIPANTWLFNGNGIRFRPAFFRWIFYERLTKLISGYIGTIFLVVGSIKIVKDKKAMWLFGSFLLAALLYLFILATGNVQHDYYQIVIMPAVAIAMGFGATWLILFLEKHTSKILSWGIVSLLLLSSFYLSWQQVKDYFNINNHAIITAGEAVQKLTPKDAKIIAPLDGDTTLLYALHRKGWPSFEHDLPTLISMGADYLLLINPKPQDLYFAKTYKLVSSESAFLLYNLHKSP